MSNDRIGRLQAYIAKLKAQIETEKNAEKKEFFLRDLKKTEAVIERLVLERK